MSFIVLYYNYSGTKKQEVPMESPSLKLVNNIQDIKEQINLLYEALDRISEVSITRYGPGEDNKRFFSFVKVWGFILDGTLRCIFLLSC